MALKPLRFETKEDLIEFFKRLQTMNLIRLEYNKIKISSRYKLKQQFLKASDGNIYLLDDVQNYLKTATPSEIELTKISFFSKNATTDQKELVTLAQIAAAPDLFKQLIVTNEPIYVLEQLNPQIYVDLLTPASESIGKIPRAQRKYSNTQLSTYLDNSKMYSLDIVLKHYQQRSNDTNYVPIPRNGDDFINPYLMDIYRITLMQQIKLQYDLYLRQAVNRNKPTRLAELNAWVKENEQNIIKIENVLAKNIKILNKHVELTEKTQLKFAKMFQEDPELVEVALAIADTEEQLKELNASLEQLENLFSVLKPFAVLATTVTLYLLFLALVFIIPSFIVALTAAVPLLGLALVILETVAALLIMSPVVHSIFDLGDTIESKFDSVLDAKKDEKNILTEKLEKYENDLRFREEYPKSFEKFIATDITPKASLQEMEIALSRVEQLECEADETLKSDMSMLNVSKVGLFSKSHSYSDLSTAEVQKESQVNFCS